MTKHNFLKIDSFLYGKVSMTITPTNKAETNYSLRPSGGGGEEAYRKLFKIRLKSFLR
jgi:hypothetical protein